MKILAKFNKGDSFRIGIVFSVERVRGKSLNVLEYFLIFELGYYRFWIGLLLNTK